MVGELKLACSTSTALGKCQVLKECCANSLTHLLLREKKYGKKYSKVLRNSTYVHLR